MIVNEASHPFLVASSGTIYTGEKFPFSAAQFCWFFVRSAPGCWGGLAGSLYVQASHWSLILPSSG